MILSTPTLNTKAGTPDRQFISPKNRRQFFHKANNTCARCHLRFPDKDLAIDHIYPLIKGGQDTPNNYQVLCKSCNIKKVSEDKKQPQRGIQARFVAPNTVQITDLAKMHTISESAKILGVSRVTLHRWIRQGKLKPESAWGRSFFTIEQLRPHVIQKCSTCYHQRDSKCACREPADIEKRPFECGDWSWKWS